MRSYLFDCFVGFQRFEELDFPRWRDDDDRLARTNREPEGTTGFVVVLVKQIFRRINPPIADFTFQVELEEIQQLLVRCVIRCSHNLTPKCPDDLTLERNRGWATWTFGGGVPSTQLLNPRI